LFLSHLYSAFHNTGVEHSGKGLGMKSRTHSLAVFCCVSFIVGVFVPLSFGQSSRLRGGITPAFDKTAGQGSGLEIRISGFENLQG